MPIDPFSGTFSGFTAHRRRIQKGFRARGHTGRIGKIARIADEHWPKRRSPCPRTAEPGDRGEHRVRVVDREDVCRGAPVAALARARLVLRVEDLRLGLPGVTVQPEQGAGARVDAHRHLETVRRDHGRTQRDVGTHARGLLFADHTQDQVEIDVARLDTGLGRAVAALLDDDCARWDTPEFTPGPLTDVRDEGLDDTIKEAHGRMVPRWRNRGGRRSRPRSALCRRRSRGWLRPRA